MNVKRRLELNKPKWLKTKIPTGKNFFEIKRSLRASKLNTVCEEAKCPNIGECWNSRTATFMMLGDTCTRACRFCHIKTASQPPKPDSNEAMEIAGNCQKMKLEYVVLTMVNRDDLGDGGASHIKGVIQAIKSQNPQIKVELLAGDFQLDKNALDEVLSSGLSVFAHNIETVERLSKRVRDARADFNQSLSVLRHAKERNSEQLIKSSIMIGLGENDQDIHQTIEKLADISLDMLTIGQYMRPTPKHLSVKEWVEPAKFEYWRQAAIDLGIKAVVSGPLVRSSYKANEFYQSLTS